MPGATGGHGCPDVGDATEGSAEPRRREQLADLDILMSRWCRVRKYAGRERSATSAALLVQERPRIDLATIDVDFEMHVRAGRAAGGTGLGDFLTHAN